MGTKSKKKNKNRQNKANTSENHLEEMSVTKNVDEDSGEKSDSNGLTEEQGQKRKFDNNDDPDSDESPKKIKKKKKTAQPEPGTEKKGKKSIRQMKKERHAQRQAEAEAAAKDQLKTQCLSYLSQWKHDKQNWKFMKAKQVWLYKNKFSATLIPDASWPLLLEYFESAQGNIRNMLLEDANKIIKQMDEWTEKQEQEDDNTEEKEDDSSVNKPNDTVYNRARNLIQCLAE